MMAAMSGRRAALATIAIAVLVASLAVAGCGGAGSSSTATNVADTTGNTNFAGASANPPKPAPPLQLDNYLGQPVNIKNYRGKAVLVLFVYDHCPDVCPLMVSNLHAAQSQMSASERKQMQIVAVSVDPKGVTLRRRSRSSSPSTR
jgi:protein SCO1/2